MAKIVRANKDLEIRKSEAIVKARYKLSPLAIKFISVVLSNLKRSDDINEEYIIKVKDFKELTGQKTNRIYELIDEALDNLLKNPITIPLGDEKNSILKANWVSGAIYNDGEVRFMIYPKLRPFLLEVKEKFLKYKLENILPLRSSYSIRLYEILKDWFELHNRYGSKAEKIISINELRDILEISKGYRYNDIKRQILEKSREELKKHTDIIFDYEEIKEGRKVTHLKFFIRPNPDKQVNYNIMDKYFKSR
ncbi:MAG TPA: RepB family plasmid replication initiator protein, partial [Nautiliaceae bacterium]|nr:RepB family plasmid replication initiator protein [Nautiliaceae bacterium]